MLLDRRDKERPGVRTENTTFEEYGQLDYPKRKGLLARIAQRMIVKGHSAITESDACKQIAEGLKSFSLKEESAPRVFRALVERSGMLQESSDQKIEFLHNTLKEFLAAERFGNAGDYQTLAKHCSEESWQPVILFAVAMPRDGSDFGKKLLKGVHKNTDMSDPPKGRKQKDRKRAADLRAAQFFFFRCCTTAYQVDDRNVRKAFEELAERLLPPRNITDAEALAACGESVVPFLIHQENLNGQQLAACIRALGIIGGRRAIAFIKQNAEDSRAAVNREVRTLFVKNPDVFWLVSKALLSIDLSNTLVQDLTPLAAHTNLESLNLNFTLVSDLTPLKNLRNLKSLSVNGTRVIDLTPLQDLTELRTLSIYNTLVSDLSALTNLTGLTALNANRSQVQDLLPLAKLTKLETLSLSNTRVRDLESLLNLTSLESLELNRTLVRDVSPLRNLENLRRLSVSSTRITDLGPLENLTKLHTLNLNYSPVKDVAVLKKLTNLRWLNLYRTNVRDVSPLRALHRLSISGPEFPK